MTDEKALLWMRANPQFARAMACRGALRAYPLIMYALRSRGDAKPYDLAPFALAVSRAAITVAATSRSDGDSEIAEAAAKSAVFLERHRRDSPYARSNPWSWHSPLSRLGRASDPAIASFLASEALKAATASTPDEAAELAVSSNEDVDLRRYDPQMGPAIGEYMKSRKASFAADLDHSLHLRRSSELYAFPLWKDHVPDAMKEILEEFELGASGSDNPWRFWWEWYESFLDGRALQWDLQREIALLPGEDWEKGAEHVAECIEEIRARLEVRRRAGETKALLTTYEAPQIGHNRSPEPIEDPPTTEDMDRLVRAVRIVLAETQKTSAERPTVEAAVEEIESFRRRAANHLGAKFDMTADAFLTGFFNTAGKLAAAGTVTATSAYLLKLMGLLPPLMEAIARWLPYLG